MIIKGGASGNVGFWSRHLLRDDTNERAEVLEYRGLSAGTLQGALREMQAVAAGSRCHGNFMYQANINPRAHEHLTPGQWAKAIDTLEHNLGLAGHQRVVVAHVKGGREHRHIIFNRVNIDTLRVADIGGNYRIHERTARQLEKAFGLSPTPRKQGPRATSRPAQFWERERGKRSGFDPSAITAQVSALWRASDNSRAFVAALRAYGYILARGRRGFCLIDPAGDVHSLARRLEGVTTAQLRAHLSDIDLNRLPTVAAARALHGKRDPCQPRERGGAFASGAAGAFMVQPVRCARYVAAASIPVCSFRDLGERRV